MENQQEQSQITKPKKSIFKKWWFWTIAVLVLILIIGTSGGEKKTEKKITPKVTEETTSTTEKKLSYDIIDEGGRETMMENEKRYEVLVVTGEKDKDNLVKMAKGLKEKYQEQYAKYGDVQIYIYDVKHKKEVSDYLDISYEESIEKADYYDKFTVATILLKEKDSLNVLYLYKDGKISETIEDF